MHISQRKQRKEDFNKLREAFQKDQVLSDRMSYRAANWDEALNQYISEDGTRRGL